LRDSNLLDNPKPLEPAVSEHVQQGTPHGMASFRKLGDLCLIIDELSHFKGLHLQDDIPDKHSIWADLFVLTKPNDDDYGVVEDGAHNAHLNALFCIILLIDANCVGPNPGFTTCLVDVELD
jgi:hypothetical protein